MAQSFVDYVKDLWNSVFKSKENTAVYNEERKKLEDYLSEAAKAEQDSRLPDAPQYERMENAAVSDEEIEKRAKDELAGYESSSRSAIETENEALNKKYSEDKAAAQKSFYEKNAAVESAYSKAKEDSSNDSLKRGLARSSIALNKQYSLNENEAAAKTALASEINSKIEALDNEISALGVKREKAMNDFNIAYAAKLTTLINGLKDERETKKAEALKYNNSLTEKEHSAAVDKEMNESSLYTQSLNQKKLKNDLGDTTDYSANYSIMRTILSKLSPSEARKALAEDAIFKENLSERYYYMLYDEFGR